RLVPEQERDAEQHGSVSAIEEAEQRRRTALGAAQRGDDDVRIQNDPRMRYDVMSNTARLLQT
ncbi:MAG TPA: hypothetical protein VFG47_01240, partial [Geminicoccaceae bacterium]|nr:hypothetical protein [Geminicoccaceae bacterium]